MQCSGVKQDGSRCGMQAPSVKGRQEMPGMWYCAKHRHLSEVLDRASLRGGK